MASKDLTVESTQRRKFIASLAGVGAIAALPNMGYARSEADSASVCGDVSAADSLYLYQSLIPRLQANAIQYFRRDESSAFKIFTEQLEQIWKLADRLKAKLPKQSTYLPPIQRLKTVARAARADHHAVPASQRHDLNFQPLERRLRRSSGTEMFLTDELVEVANDLSEGSRQSLDSEQWALLQQLLSAIDKMKKEDFPNLVKARTTFDKGIITINNSIFAATDALLDASRSIVENENQQAQKALERALKALSALPTPVKQSNVSPDSVSSREGEVTRDDVIALVQAAQKLLSEPAHLPKISRVADEPAKFVAIKYPSELKILASAFDPSSVREIVREFFKAGNWWQVVGVTAACLPLWSAYPKGERRKALIFSALQAVPRSPGTKLWEAAYYLNNLIT